MGTADSRRFDLSEESRPLIWGGIVLGAGFGAFFDGIVFHQILQWHHMLTSHPDPGVASDLPLNTLWDGLFHALAYALTALGVALIVRAWRRGAPPSTRALAGVVLIGWGAFNLVEGTINHHLLSVHHVRPDGPGGALVWDLGFLAWGGVMVGVGYALVRSSSVRESGDDADTARGEEPTDV